MYLRAVLCTFQISIDFYFVPVGGRGGWRGLFWAQMALAALVPFMGPKKSRFLGPHPLKCPSLWIVPPQNHFVPPHINNRYINNYSVLSIYYRYSLAWRQRRAALGGRRCTPTPLRPPPAPSRPVPAPLPPAPGVAGGCTVHIHTVVNRVQ
jgi:hypothetical protein